MKQGLPKVPTIKEYLKDLAVEHYKEYGRELVVGIDPFVHPASFASEVMEAFESASKEHFSESKDENGYIVKQDPPTIGSIQTVDQSDNLVMQSGKVVHLSPPHPFVSIHWSMQA